jgi:hypothetical protein
VQELARRNKARISLRPHCGPFPFSISPSLQLAASYNESDWWPAVSNIEVAIRHESNLTEVRLADKSRRGFISTL